MQWAFFIKMWGERKAFLKYLRSIFKQEMQERLHFDGCGSDDHSAIAKYYEKISGSEIK